MRAVTKAGVQIVSRWVKPSISRANIAVTYLCNQKCRSCNIWKYYQDELSKGEFKLCNELVTWEFEEIIKNNHLIWVSLTGGEPFLRKDIEDVCSRVGLDFSINIIPRVDGSPAGIFAGHFVDAHREAIKLLLSRPTCFDDNLRRQQYNIMLKDTFSEDDYVFDVALIESINPEGMSCYSEVRDVDIVLIKAPEYSIVNSHLTVEGRKKVAEQLLIMLVKMANAN